MAYVLVEVDENKFAFRKTDHVTKQKINNKKYKRKQKQINYSKRINRN